VARQLKRGALMQKDKIKLIAILSILLVAGFLATSLVSYFVSRTSLRAEIAHSALPLTSDNIYSEIQRDLLRPVFIASLMAADTFLRDWVLQGEQDEKQIRNFLKEIQTRYNTITSFFVSDQTGLYYHADGILKKVSPAAKRDRWYYRVKHMQAPYELNIDPDMANKDTMTIFVNYRVLDYADNYIGATGVGLTVSAVKSLIEKYQQKYDRLIYMIDQRGRVKLAGKNFPKYTSNVFKDERFTPFAQTITANKQSAFSYHNGQETIHTNARLIPEFGWYLIVEQAEGKTTRQIVRTLFINLTICLIVTAIVLVLLFKAITAYQNKIDTLRGIVPICSFCKQIRDDQGYWNQVEAYVSKHTDATFSHGICPACKEKHYSKYMPKPEPEKPSAP
jgi:hypothetical protein